jgi:hypothetical protein
MDETRVTKKGFESKAKIIRNVGRPRWRCLEGEENDLRELKMERWGKTGELGCVVREAEVFRGRYSQEICMCKGWA